MLNAVPPHDSQLYRRRMVRENLERLRSCADLDRGRLASKTWGSLLELSAPQLERIDSFDTDIPTQALERVAAHFKLDAQSLMGEGIDFREVAIRIQPKSKLPKPYSTAAFGRRRSTITSLDYVEKKSGWRVKRDIFRRFRVTEAMFSNSMDPINMNFLTQVSCHLGQFYGYERQALYRMGAHLYTGGKSPIIEKVFSSCRGPAELYSRFFGDMMKFFELNCHYDIIKLDNFICVFDVRSRSDVAEALRVKHLGSRELCAVKAGFISSMTGYLGLPFANIRELTCVHLGDATCRYELRFQKAKQPS